MEWMSKAQTERLEEREALLTELESAGYLTEPRLEEAMLGVPRHLFVPQDLGEAAYHDRPLPVGFGQTVSAPHMVAMMTTALQLEPGQKVLEIGTGVGYHAAVVKYLVGEQGEVHSVEYMPELVELARQNVAAAKQDVRVHEGDGFEGYPDAAPYDAIYVTCAIPTIPDALMEQLKDGGHFVAPVGITRCQLLAGRRIGDELELDDLGPCLFVNAQGRLGQDEGGYDPLGADEFDDDDDDDDDFDDDDDDDEGGQMVPTP